MLKDRIRRHFEASIQAKQATLEQALPNIVGGAEKLAAALRGGAKLLVCGNGGSAADAQHFAAEFVGRYERERPGLAAIALTTDSSALTAIANDYSYNEVFSKQVRALARPGDWLVAISTSGNSPNVVSAMAAAHAIGAQVLALTGKDGGAMARALKDGDIELRAASTVTARIQEVHILLLHCLCDAVDEILYPAK